MNVPLVNQCIRRNRGFWPACPMQGVHMYSTQDGLLGPRQATQGCFPAEVIDLVDDDSSTGTFDLAYIKNTSTDVGLQVNRDSTKPLDTRKRMLVIELVDDDSSLETVHPPTIEGWSLGSMSEVSEDDFKGIHGWETLTDTFDCETSASVVQHDDDGSDIVTALIWDGGSLSFLDGLNESEMPTDFCDDDISAIAVQVDTEASAVVAASEGLIWEESLSFLDSLEEGEMSIDFLDDDNSSVIVLPESNMCTVSPALAIKLNHDTSCSFLDRPTRMGSVDDETPCTRFGVQPDKEAYKNVVAAPEEFDLDFSLFSLMLDVGFIVPWDNGNDKSTNVQDANAPPTTGHDFLMASFDCQALPIQR